MRGRPRRLRAKDKLHEELDAVRRRVGDGPPVRTLLAMSDSDLSCVGGGNFMDDLLTIAGGKISSTAATILFRPSIVKDFFR